ncbi:hypothetical protein [Caldisericum sp.]|uniref:hypothetical protein n=1 Tax=Caldisericum sp. TaxID=2499687 RepID=UPI003D0E1442
MDIRRLKLIYMTTTGPASYSAGGFNVTVAEVRNINSVVNVMGINTGYMPVVASTSGNVVTVKVFDTTTGEEVANATNLSSITFALIVAGF